ncbi:hypothetical protein NA57DRAFT_31946 [Rhizodiscina lignyota]|uniref:Sulfotransferase family protein n=1 Tax=Rhizodiscina lignyota TaxID=1504668 RepID=A0A9P4ISI0_9PEZI|nr:hypothetical protein NA57DRAFT_31946 [Rhizodiscina lignyota]
MFYIALLLPFIIFPIIWSIPRFKPKVFVVGLNKTGTTSLGDALATLGYKRLGWKDLLSRKLFHDWYSGNLQHLIGLSRTYDAFEDLPWTFLYEEMATMYPDAKFILTLRNDEEKWWRSIHAHTNRNGWVGHELLYGSQFANESNKETYVSIYRSHNDRVREFFKDQPHRLLELRIDNGLRWEELCEFLGKKNIPKTAFPRSNPKDKWSNVDHLKIFWVWGKFVNWVETLLVTWLYYAGKLPGHPALARIETS